MNMKYPFARIAAAVLLSLSTGLTASSARAQAPAGGKLPDILGITTGMGPQQALNLLKEHDPGHSVSLTQWTIPQIYGDKPITLGMTAATTGQEIFYVQLTFPPSPQVVWEVFRTIPRFTSTTPNVLKSLYDKYGPPWFPYSPPGSPARNPGQLHWYFDAQGRPVRPAGQADSMAFQTCIGQVMQEWYSAFPPWPSPRTVTTSNGLMPGNPRTSIQTMPATFDLSRNTLCNNLIAVTVSINGGNVRNEDLSFTLDITIDDYTAQHRAGMALNDALNTIVAQGAHKDRVEAGQQKVPTL